MKRQRKNAGGRKSEHTPIILSPNLRLSKAQQGVSIINRTLQPPISVQELTTNLPNNPRLRGNSHQNKKRSTEVIIIQKLKDLYEKMSVEKKVTVLLECRKCVS